MIKELCTSLMVILITILLHSVNVGAGEDPLVNGEFNLELYRNNGTIISFPIVITSVSTVWGSKDDGNGYEKTSNYTNLTDETTNTVRFEHVDDPNSPFPEFAYGKYKVSVNDSGWKTVYFDARDCDYQDGVDDHGTNYDNPDIFLFYNSGTDKFYRTKGVGGEWDESTVLPLGSTEGIWEEERKSPASPRHFCFEGIDPPTQNNITSQNNRPKINWSFSFVPNGGGEPTPVRFKVYRKDLWWEQTTMLGTVSWQNGTSSYSFVDQTAFSSGSGAFQRQVLDYDSLERVRIGYGIRRFKHEG